MSATRKRYRIVGTKKTDGTATTLLVDAVNPKFAESVAIDSGVLISSVEMIDDNPPMAAPPAPSYRAAELVAVALMIIGVFGIAGGFCELLNGCNMATYDAADGVRRTFALEAGVSVGVMGLLLIWAGCILELLRAIAIKIKK